MLLLPAVVTVKQTKRRRGSGFHSIPSSRPERASRRANERMSEQKPVFSSSSSHIIFHRPRPARPSSRTRHHHRLPAPSRLPGQCTQYKTEIPTVRTWATSVQWVGRNKFRQIFYGQRRCTQTYTYTEWQIILAAPNQPEPIGKQRTLQCRHEFSTRISAF